MQAERQWHYAISGQKAGPIAEPELRRLIRIGVLNGQSLIWTEGWPQWQPVTAVPELQIEILSIPALPPSAAQPDKPAEGIAIATLLCGALGLSAVFCCATAPLSLIAVVIGHITLGRTDLDPNSHQLAKIGLIMGYIGVGIMVLPLILWIFFDGWPNQLPGIFRSFQRGFNA